MWNCEIAGIATVLVAFISVVSTVVTVSVILTFIRPQRRNFPYKSSFSSSVENLCLIFVGVSAVLFYGHNARHKQVRQFQVWREITEICEWKSTQFSSTPSSSSNIRKKYFFPRSDFRTSRQKGVRKQKSMRDVREKVWNMNWLNISLLPRLMAQYWNIKISYLSVAADTRRIAHTFAATAKLNFVSVQFILDKCTLLYDMNFTYVGHFHIFLAQKSVIASM